MNSIKKNINLKHAVMLFFSAAQAAALYLFFNTGPIIIISYITASGLYFLYTVFSSVDNSTGADYIQSGDGALTLLFFLTASRFFTENTLLLFPVSAIMLIIVFILIQKIYPHSAAGFIINPLAIFIIIYLFYFDKNFSMAFIKKLLTGIAEKNHNTIIIFPLIFFISLFFIYKYRSSGAILSHGKNYSGNYLKLETFYSNLFLLLKYILIISALFLTGITGFAAYYIYRFSYRGKINIGMIFVFIFFNLSVLMFLKLADPFVVTSAVIILSIISHYIYKLNRVDIYGRSIRYKL